MDSSTERMAREDTLHVGAARPARLFGLPYPYEELTILEIPEWGWGQAPPGLILH